MARKKAEQTNNDAQPTEPTEAQALAAEAAKQISEGRDRLKEAKALGKLLGSLDKLSGWGRGKLREAIDARDYAA